jgi:alpha-L-fucosidase 2
MKNPAIPRVQRIIKSMLAVLLQASLATCAAQDYAPPAVEIDWPAFLARQDPVWEQLPREFDDSAQVGNGLAGVSVYRQGGDNVLRFDVGRTDVVDSRPPESWLPAHGRCRLPIGHFSLHPVGMIARGTLRTDLWNAEVRGEIETDKGTITVRALAHATDYDNPFDLFAIQQFNPGRRQPVIVVDVETTGEERECRWEWQAEPSASTSQPPPEYQPNPPAVLAEEAGVKTCEQSLLVGGGYATAWREQAGGDGRRRIFISVATSPRPGVARRDAIESVNRAAAADFAAFLAGHRGWWHAYYPQSFVSLPCGRLENYYWLQVYRLASATRAHGASLDTQGPWFRSTIWPMWWWDLNNQTAYMPVYTANRLELGLSLVHWLDRNLGNFISNVRPEYRWDSAGLWANSGIDGRAPIELGIESLHPFAGCLPWACHNYWLHYRYSMDPRLLERLYPLLRRSINYYRHIMIRSADGTIHLPATASPEYGVGVDCNFDLALFRWGCQALLEAAERLGYDDPLIPEWREILGKLADYPVDENGFRLSADIPLAMSHRHWHHLQMVFPLYLVNWDQPERRDLIRKSLEHWIHAGQGPGWDVVEKQQAALEPPSHLFGRNGLGYLEPWSYYAASSMYASMGDGARTIECLMQHLTPPPRTPQAPRRGFTANGAYLEGDPVFEAGVSGMASIQNMLLQSWGGTIRVFPAMPVEWPEGVFHDLRAEGAFLVSAGWKNGRTEWIRIKSLAGEPCRLATDLADGFLSSSPQPDCTATQVAPRLVEINVAKDGEILLRRDSGVTPAIRPVPAADGISNHYGCKVQALIEPGVPSR